MQKNNMEKINCEHKFIDNMNNLAKYKWYKATIPTKRWNEYYSKVGSFTFLSGDKQNTQIGFLSVYPPYGCLEITNPDELMQIDHHRRAVNHRPYVTEDIK